MINNKFLKNKNIEELKRELFILNNQKFNLRMSFFLNKIKRNHLIRRCKKNISIIKTILWEKNLDDKKKKY